MAAKKKTAPSRRKNEVAKSSFAKDVMDLGYSGFENVDENLIQMPWLKIAQKSTPEADQGSEVYLDGLKPGYFFNSVSGNVYGEKIQVVLLGFDRKYIEWGEDFGSVKNRYSPAELKELIESGEITENEDKPWEYVSSTGGRIIDMHVFLVLLPEYQDDGLMFFSLKSTQLKYSRKLLTKARAQKWTVDGQVKSAPMFCIVWELTSMREENEMGSWYGIGTAKMLAANRIGTLLDPKFRSLQQPIMDAAITAKELKEKNIDYTGAAERDARAVDDDPFGDA